MTIETEELLDIVDENDNVIDSMFRSEAYQKKLFSSLRAVWLFVKNDKGQLWIPRRHARKKILPGALEGSTVGHVSSGESYEESLLRETQEELCINLRDHDYRYLGKVTPKDDGAFCFAQVYEVSLEDIPCWNKEDFSEFYWLTPQEIIERVNRGEKIKDSLLLMIKKFYL